MWPPFSTSSRIQLYHITDVLQLNPQVCQIFDIPNFCEDLSHSFGLIVNNEEILRFAARYVSPITLHIGKCAKLFTAATSKRSNYGWMQSEQRWTTLHHLWIAQVWLYGPLAITSDLSKDIPKMMSSVCFPSATDLQVLVSSVSLLQHPRWMVTGRPNHRARVEPHHYAS